MNAWAIDRIGSLEGLRLKDWPEASPKPGEVLLKVRAVSLNYRDLTATRKERPGNLPLPFVLCSDAAGEVMEVGEGVVAWKPGDRVFGTFFQSWPDGPISRQIMGHALGGPIHGVLKQMVALREDGLVLIPPNLSFEEAACLPCAGVTAWHGLCAKGLLQAGDSVLALGTGGVSIFTLQIAKALGARVIITSSSDEKLERARSLNADETINYRTTPDWEQRVFELTEKRGVDHVMEVGGAGTLEKSLAALAFGGRITLVGVLTGFETKINPWPIVARSVAVQGVYVGSTKMAKDLAAFVAAHDLRPVIDRVFPYEEAREAFRYLDSGKHFGKIVIRLP